MKKRGSDARRPLASQKAPNAKGCIKTLCHCLAEDSRLTGQKAPSAKGCIKTPRHRKTHLGLERKRVRMHRAPKGALRLDRQAEHSYHPFHRQNTPSAKRCIKTQLVTVGACPHLGQKAPSAKGRIKTRHRRSRTHQQLDVRKYRAPKGALRLCICACQKHLVIIRSESTERHKVY